MIKLMVAFLLLTAPPPDDYRIGGRVIMSDSTGVGQVRVRILGFGVDTTDAHGYFAFAITEAQREDYFLRSGVDLFIRVLRNDLVMLDPANGKIRLPHDPSRQEIQTLMMVHRGSPLLLSEPMLDVVIRRRIKAAVANKENQMAWQLETAKEAARLGLSEESLRLAVDTYKESLRTSPDEQKRGLAALDDAYAATEPKIRQEKTETAKSHFREAIRKDERDVAQGKAAEQRLPDGYFYLGETFFSEARYDSSLYYYHKADSLKPGDPEQLNMLGLVLRELAHFERALEVFTKALAIDTTLHGRNHPEVAIRLNNIGAVLEDQGDYKNALEKFNQALQIDQEYFGTNHPKVAIRLNNIAGVLREQGDYKKALEKYNEALAIFEDRFGRNHPNIAVALNNIGGVLKAQGDYKEALEKYNQALAIFEDRFGRNHPNIAVALNNIGAVLEDQGDYKEALEKFNEALQIDQAYFGLSHPEVATDLNNIGVVLQAQGDYKNALEKYNQALQIDQEYFGHNHPEVATDLNNIAGVLQAQGDYKNALEKYNQALAIFEDFLGPDHPNTKTVRANRDQAWVESLPEKEQWRLRTQQYFAWLNDASIPKTDTLRLALYNQLGVGYIKQEKGDSALIYLKLALPLAQALDQKEMAGTVLNNIGSAYKTLHDWAQAEDFLRRSIDYNTALLGDSAAVLAFSYFHLSAVMVATAAPERARPYAETAEAIAQKQALDDLVGQIRAVLRALDEE